MELRNVRSLVHLAQTGSITRAAAALDLTPAAVHKQLRVLEKELGVKLYQKMGGALRLTEQGRLLLPDLQRLLEDERSVMERAEGSKQLRSGVVRIGSGVSMSACLLPPLLRRFRKLHPGVDDRKYLSTLWNGWNENAGMLYMTPVDSLKVDFLSQTKVCGTNGGQESNGRTAPSPTTA